MNICLKACEASNRFEKCNAELKKEYLIKNICTINMIMSRVSGYCGSFGTGYPFYVLDNNLNGNLPIIYEQIRYNNELYNETKDLSMWTCEKCLATCSMQMPDLKQICKPCPQVKDSIKPRKVINRLPDIDMWMVCEDIKIDNAKNELIKLFEFFEMHTSDIDPVKTINEVNEISLELEIGIMPKRYLPLDIHIIEYSKFSALLDEIPFSLLYAVENKQIPFLSIHPISLRKTWQYDDVAYNFVLDYLFSLTPFNFEEKLSRKLMLSRDIINNNFSEEELKNILDLVSPDFVKRRFETDELRKCYEMRLKRWKK